MKTAKEAIAVPWSEGAKDSKRSGRMQGHAARGD